MSYSYLNACSPFLNNVEGEEVKEERLRRRRECDRLRREGKTCEKRCNFFKNDLTLWCTHSYRLAGCREWARNRCPAMSIILYSFYSAFGDYNMSLCSIIHCPYTWRSYIRTIIAILCHSSICIPMMFVPTVRLVQACPNQGVNLNYPTHRY